MHAPPIPPYICYGALQSKVPPYTCACYDVPPIQSPSLHLCMPLQSLPTFVMVPSNPKSLPTPVRVMMSLQSKVPPYTCACYGAPPIQSPSLHLCVLWCPSNSKALSTPVCVMIVLPKVFCNILSHQKILRDHKINRENSLKRHHIIH